ncbi:uncharacterized protein KIAA0513-like [Centruroides sculpturatus]|uniref:uncharacterized protein KIAA0513-like n=1 Tax=Centruroides sculpturatus TaxID=218467 RepID=UPI000C6CDF6C|nr:uncharacterized protein KIAA0513-like [Centruroides sculpturatus]
MTCHTNKKEDLNILQEKPTLPDSRKRSHSFLSSVFNSGNNSECNKDIPNKNFDSFWNSSGKSSKFFTSVLNTNQILTGLSSKLEAALNLSFDVLDSDTSSRSANTSAKTSPVQDVSTSGISSRRSSLPSGNYSKAANTYYYVKQHRQRSARRKDRSVYGQPEIDLKNTDLKVRIQNESSEDSLLAADSDQSLGNNSTQSCSNKHDPFYVFRNTDSAGVSSESDACGHSTSLDSSDAESIPESRDLGLGRSGSGGSIQSWSSSCDSQLDEFNQLVIEFMKLFVQKIFNRKSITYEEKARFGELSQHELGRLWFSRCVNAQRVNNKQVDEYTFYCLVQYFAIVLFECDCADDFSPAKSLMNMCFTFFYETKVNSSSAKKEYLFTYLKEQPIWHSLRFWNAAFFDAVQCERSHRTVPTRKDFRNYSPEEMSDEKQFQENITFGQLGTFTYNMHAFGLSKKFCLQFLHKQCTIANLPKEQVQLLEENIERIYRE